MHGKCEEMEEGLLSSRPSSESMNTVFVRERSTKPQRLWWWTIANVIVSVILGLIILSQFVFDGASSNKLLKLTSFYSPVLEEIEIPTFVSQVDGGIAASTKPSPARLPPGSEADDAWHRFEDIRTVVLSESDIIGLGKDPSTAARFPDSHWNFGEGAYMGQLDVVHQIHCLNQLRKRAFIGYFPDDGHKVAHGPEWRWIHLQHCVSILLENLMCNANTDMITLNWIEEADYPFPDFSVNKQCRDFEAVMKWQEDRAVDRDQWLSMAKPKEGANIIKGEEEWWSLFEKNGSAVFKEHHEHGH